MILIILNMALLADPNDFVNPKYIVAAKGDPATNDARSSIVRSSAASAKKGPWSMYY